MTTISNIQSRIAGLADGQQVISGVAVGVGDVTRGLSGDQKVWQADALRAAASSLEGAPVKALHSQTEIGEVVRAGYDAGRGVVYEAQLEDSKLADRVAQGGLEVSVEARHADGGTVETGRGEAMAATDIRFEALALVQHGAAPSASAEPGEAAALSPADIRETLEEDPASTNGDASDIEISDQTETALENKRDEHNEEAPENKHVTLGTLKKVYRRGAGAWFSSNGGATQNQWAMARVNAFLEDLRNDRPLNEGNDNDLAPDGYSPAEASALAKVNGQEIDLTPPDRVTNAIEAAMDAKEEYAGQIGDCGTGVGEAMGQAILDGPSPELLLNGADVAQNSPAGYLDSHSEDVAGIDEPPTEWGEETWTDGCGPVQHALWGHYLDWFEGKQQEIEAAMEESDMAKHQGQEADMAEVPDEYVFNNPGEAVSKAKEMGVGEGEELAGDEMIHTHGDGEDTVFMPGQSHADLMDMLREMGEISGGGGSSTGEDAEMAETKNIGPIDFKGTAEGELDESKLPTDPEQFRGHYLNAEDTKSASSFPLVDADGDLRRGNLDAAWNLRGQGDLGMPRDVAERTMLNLGLVFGPPDSEANPLPQEAYAKAEEEGIEVGTPYAAEAAATDDAVNPERGSAEVSSGGEPAERTDSESTRYNAHMSETEEELRARLSEKDDEIAELENRVEQLESERADVARAYAEALAAGDTVFDEDDLVEKFSVAELREKFEDTEADLVDPEPTVQSGSDGSTESATLSDAEREQVAAHRDVIADLAGSDTTIAQKERQRRAELVAEITGEDPDTILDQES